MAAAPKITPTPKKTVRDYVTAHSHRERMRKELRDAERQLAVNAGELLDARRADQTTAADVLSGKVSADADVERLRAARQSIRLRIAACEAAVRGAGEDLAAAAADMRRELAEQLRPLKRDAVRAFVVELITASRRVQCGDDADQAGPAILLPGVREALPATIPLGCHADPFSPVAAVVGAALEAGHLDRRADVALLTGFQPAETWTAYIAAKFADGKKAKSEARAQKRTAREAAGMTPRAFADRWPT